MTETSVSAQPNSDPVTNNYADPADTTRHLDLFSDDPRDGSELRPDDLDREGFAQHVVDILNDVRKHNESTVLALIGDWGSGKTSLIEMLQRSMSETEWLITSFNPCLYPDAAGLSRGFFAELMNALPQDSQSGVVRKKIAEFARTVSPFGNLLSLVGLNASGMIRTISD